jgi:hypothetical protein
MPIVNTAKQINSGIWVVFNTAKICAWQRYKFHDLMQKTMERMTTIPEMQSIYLGGQKRKNEKWKGAKEQIVSIEGH